MEYINKTINADVLEGLKLIPENSINTCVTSPPYWGLRDYGVDGQLGLEDTPEEFILNMVDVFREVKRVLKEDGTLWLNIGDSYAGSGKAKGDKNPEKYKQRPNRSSIHTENNNLITHFTSADYKRKDLIGIPWMLAFALRADGWYLRQDIIWHKPNPMPESVKDRCTKAHEYIFLLSKSPTYYYDADSIKQPASNNTNARRSRAESSHKSIPDQKKNGIRPRKRNVPAGWDTSKGSHDKKVGRYPRVKDNQSFDSYLNDVVENKNKRSVWTIKPEAMKEAHFATFPQKLITDCIKAGSPVGGIVLDPFMGSGTTGIVARKLDRNYIGIELNPDYIKIEDRRKNKELGMFQTSAI